MRFTGHVSNSGVDHRAEVGIGEKRTTLQIASKPTGRGSSVSGGELLMLALATCYCNDVYREAAAMGIEVAAVDVEVTADFAAEGAAAGDVSYSATITANASNERIRALAARADSMAEIQNTVRRAIPVRLSSVEARSTHGDVS